MAKELDGMFDTRNAKLNVLGPRGAAKSTLGTLAFPLRAAVEGREPYIWIVSDTMYQARQHLENLKRELLDNPILAQAYPQSVGRDKLGTRTDCDSLARTVGHSGNCHWFGPRNSGGW
jgi:hypothetical protein